MESYLWKIRWWFNRSWDPRLWFDCIKDTLHKGHAGLFIIRYVANCYFWWSHINRQIQLTAANCKECNKSGKNLKPVIPSTEVAQRDLMEEPNHENQMECLGPLFAFWGTNKYLLICVDLFSKFPTVQITTRTTATVIGNFFVKLYYSTCYTTSDPNGSRIGLCGWISSRDLSSTKYTSDFCAGGKASSYGLSGKMYPIVSRKFNGFFFSEPKSELTCKAKGYTTQHLNYSISIIELYSIWGKFWAKTKYSLAFDYSCCFSWKLDMEKWIVFSRS